MQNIVESFRSNEASTAPLPFNQSSLSSRGKDFLSILSVQKSRQQEQSFVRKSHHDTARNRMEAGTDTTALQKEKVSSREREAGIENREKEMEKLREGDFEASRRIKAREKEDSRNRISAQDRKKVTDSSEDREGREDRENQKISSEDDVRSIEEDEQKHADAARKLADLQDLLKIVDALIARLKGKNSSSEGAEKAGKLLDNMDAATKQKLSAMLKKMDALESAGKDLKKLLEAMNTSDAEGSGKKQNLNIRDMEKLQALLKKAVSEAKQAEGGTKTEAASLQMFAGKLKVQEGTDKAKDNLNTFSDASKLVSENEQTALAENMEAHKGAGKAENRYRMIRQARSTEKVASKAPEQEVLQVKQMDDASTRVDAGKNFQNTLQEKTGTSLKGQAKFSQSTGIKQPREVFNQIVDRAVLTQKSGMSEMKLQLKPKFLGRIKMQLFLKDGAFSAKIIVANQHLREFLQNNLDILGQEFRDAGLQFSGMEVGQESEQSFAEYMGDKDKAKESQKGVLAASGRSSEDGALASGDNSAVSNHAGSVDLVA